MATSSGAVIARIISQYSDKGTKAAQKDIARMGKQIDAWSRKVVKSYAVAGVAAGAFAYKIGKDSVNAAIEDSKSAAQLANSLRNVTGATTDQIAAVEEYISKQQKLVNVSDTELRSSLNTLVTATGNVTDAQYLQTRALDFAAGSGKDLAAVTTAMAKASQGNFTALGRMFPQLDKATLKSGNFAKMLGILEQDYTGAAEAVAKNDPFTALKLQFGEVAEQLGYVLLPVVQQFASYLITDVIPNMEEWIALNGTKLQESFKGTLDTLVALTINIVKIITFLEKYKEILLVIGAIPLINIVSNQALIIAGLFRQIMTGFKAIGPASTAVMGAFRGIGAAISLIAGAMKAGGFLAALRSAVQLFMMLSPQVRIVTIGLAALTAGFALFKKIFGGSDKAAQKSKLTNEQIAKQQRDSILAGYEQIAVATEKAKNDKITQDRLKANAALQKKADDAAKKRAKFDADYAKINARIAKNYGVTLLSSEDQKMVQINAAEALLKRQTTLDTINASLLKTLREEVLLMKVKNDLAMRYDDILKALADNKITTQEVQVLALKWGVAKEAVDAYLLQLKIIEDGTISEDEIIKLAKSWGSTQDQAAQYLDFFQALNDGVLDVTEIEKLKAKWGLTEQQVRQYADFVGVVNDGKLDDSEVKKLMDKWKLTSDQVVAYILKIGSPVTYSGTLIDPATAATIGWKNATDALQAYLNLLGKGTTTTNPVTPPTTTNPTLPQGSTGNVGNIDAVNKQVADASKKLVEEITATGQSSVSISKVANDMAASLLADKAATDALGGVAGVLSSARYTGQALQYAAQEAAKAKIADSEITRDALRQLTSGGTLTDDQRLRLGMSSTVSTAASITPNSSSGTTNVTVNVQGSVTSQNDLVSAIRQGLLQDQVNGKTLTVTAL
jgi:hypothetical protein